ncbi:DUF3795 domain-containing protein [candidate division WOR-3 bacterium]|nr:DUF3795 domain-containing protein [candidate division WOR-3 bacterium]
MNNIKELLARCGFYCGDCAGHSGEIVEAAGETSCEIRKCCFEKGFYACHECSDFESSDKLKPLSGLHGESCIKNLRATREMSIEYWIHKDKRFWFADNTDERGA